MAKIDFITDINKDLRNELDYSAIDKIILKVFWWHAILYVPLSLLIYFFKPASFYPSPYSWRVIGLEGVLWVIAIGFITVIAIHLLRDKLKNHYIFRLIVTQAAMMYSYLLVYITGGSIESHFHFFIMMGLLTLYLDWRLNWTAIVAVGLHHGTLNFIAPHWVYFYGRNDIAFTAHALLVLIMALLTMNVCNRGRTAVQKINDLNKKNLEKGSETITKKDKLLELQNKELVSKIEELKKFNKLTVGRELKMVELKQRIKELESPSTEKK